MQYEYLSDSYVLHIDEENRVYTRVRESKIRALVDGMDKYEDRYTWTGVGTEECPEIISRGHSLVGHPFQKENYRYYWINLGKRLRAGDVATIKTRQKFYDKERKMQPIFFRIIRTSTDVMSLSVDFNGEQSERLFMKKTSDAIHIDNVIEESEELAPSQITWEINRPEHDKAYIIEWEWKK